MFSATGGDALRARPATKNIANIANIGLIFNIEQVLYFGSRSVKYGDRSNIAPKVKNCSSDLYFKYCDALEATDN